MKRLIWKPFFHLLLQARLPWFYILVYTLLSMAASQLYLLFPSYTRQIMNGSPESGAYLYSNCRCFRTGMYYLCQPVYFRSCKCKGFSAPARAYLETNPPPSCSFF